MPRKGTAQEMHPVFEPGMIVRLKSGGPKMTVKANDSPEAEVLCLWFAGKKLESGSFAMHTIVAVKEGNKKAKR